MQNKESGNKRPCYFCFKDFENDKIMWFVPISSKVFKYKNIYNSKKKKRKKVLNFVFGKVMGKERVFLIQNIFPTTINYIDSKYQTNNKDVVITESLKSKIIEQAKEVIHLAENNIQIPFYDIINMKRILLENAQNNYTIQ